MGFVASESLEELPIDRISGASESLEELPIDRISGTLNYGFRCF